MVIKGGRGRLGGVKVADAMVLSKMFLCENVGVSLNTMVKANEVVRTTMVVVSPK
jgi:Ni2+-binding GTPase involved in maturation of urease and hydrogenase